MLPIYAGKIQCAWLGVALAAYGEDGSPVPPGGEGDLVITRPMPFMPLGFLGDDDNDTRLKDAYFNHYQHTSVWYHADHSKLVQYSCYNIYNRTSRVNLLRLSWSTVAIDNNGGITMLGRSDGVLNPQGVRFGSAELYAVVEEMKDVCVQPTVIPAYGCPLAYIGHFADLLRVDDCIAVGQRTPEGDERV